MGELERGNFLLSVGTFSRYGVTILIARITTDNKDKEQLSTEWAQVEVIDLINDGTGLAFGIIGGRSTGVVVKTILPGGVADRDGRLQSGDHILQIGEVNLRGLGSEQVASVLRQCGVHVRMVVARPIDSANAEYQLDRHLVENGITDMFAPPPPSTFTNPYIFSGHNTDSQSHGISGMVDIVKDLPLGNMPFISSKGQNNPPKAVPLDMILHEPVTPETETYVVELRKDDLGLGITVAGYVCEKATPYYFFVSEELSGIFVKSVSKGSAADLTNNIKINDRIIEVDGTSVIGLTNHQAVELLRNTGPRVLIKLERYLRGPKYEQLQQAIRANELRAPSPSSETASSLPKVPLSLVKMDFLNIEPDGESRTSFEFDSAILLEASTPINEETEIVIGEKRGTLQFSVRSQESIYDKWREKLDRDVEIMIAQMHKDPHSGLGISLEGTVDVEDGKEVRPHHYIRNILVDGPVGRNGTLQSGDELLEVNGIQLLGLNHLEVVSILKQLPNFVSLVCARYLVPIRIIDTSQRREAFQARKIFAGSLQNLLPQSENSRLVKAKSETSIAPSLASEPTASRSRSLELIAGLPMWSDEPTIVELNKGEHGLGFSILDYQDPLNPQETVIVIRSLVPGGVAQIDGRLIPGDRLLAVNDVDVQKATLDTAVQVLKGTPKGKVRITVAKPLNTNDAVSHASQLKVFIVGFRNLVEECANVLEFLARQYPLCQDPEKVGKYCPQKHWVYEILENNWRTDRRRQAHNLISEPSKANTVRERGRKEYIQKANGQRQSPDLREKTRPGKSKGSDGRGPARQGTNRRSKDKLGMQRKGKSRGRHALNLKEKEFVWKLLEEWSHEVAYLILDTEEDQTCLEDFQECIEDFQECLDVVHICIDEENSFNHSPCSSQVEDFGQKVTSAQKNVASVDFLDNSFLNIHQSRTKGHPCDSDIDISFKSTNDNYVPSTGSALCSIANVSHEKRINNNQNVKFAKTDSLTRSDRQSLASASDKDGYDTCLDDSLSEDNIKLKTKSKYQLSDFIETDSNLYSDNQKVQNNNANVENKLDTNDTTADITPTNSKLDVTVQFCVDVPEASVKAPAATGNPRGGFHSNSVEEGEVLIPNHFPPMYKYNYSGCLDTSTLQQWDMLSASSSVVAVHRVQSAHCQMPPMSTNEEPSFLIPYLIKIDKKRPGTPPGGDIEDRMRISMPCKRANVDSIQSRFAVAVSEPCLTMELFTNRHICLDTKMDDGLKSYDNQSEDPGGDEFFLVEYPPDCDREVCKRLSEPNEYYNDYQDCLEAYNNNQEGTSVKEYEQKDSRSAPDVMDRSFVTLTYDPGPDLSRRKSAFVHGVHQFNESEMTVIRPIDTDYGTLKGCHVDDMLQKHWGSTHTVKIFREPNKSLGISIVGGKVDLHPTHTSPDTILGIFVKNVVPNSPAGQTGQFKTGDRILEVSGIDLRQASHEKAVQAIRNAPNPVTFVVQSLIPWQSTKQETNPVNKANNCPTPLPAAPRSTAPVGDKNPAETNTQKSKAQIEKENGIPSVPVHIITTSSPSKNFHWPILTKLTPDLPVSPGGQSGCASALSDEEIIEKATTSYRDDSPEGSDDDDEDDIRELEGRTVSDKGQQIDRASAANVRRSKEEISADLEEEDDFGYTNTKTTTTELAALRYFVGYLLSTLDTQHVTKDKTKDCPAAGREISAPKSALNQLLTAVQTA
ncbi:hypothetical protein NQ317_010686 [Molorchus minor]|uniref:PDZ domain-containing protein n=1 Tax=Molorchus minor TaxID=1323400 RepID=A0ABQ9K7V3_9CUCU|nr:hypothetical protein NQ317_010686 [Molorchus minor]